MNWRESLICLLLFIVAYIVWQQLNTDESITTGTISNTDSLPGYYLTDTELTRYDDAGIRMYTINAQSIKQNTQINVLEIEAIAVTYGGGGDKQWTITADSAVLPNDRQYINFSGNVIAQQESEATQTIFKSNTLNYTIEEHRLTTQDVIQAEQGIQKITAKGMTLDLKNERVELHSNVKIRIQLP